MIRISSQTDFQPQFDELQQQLEDSRLAICRMPGGTDLYQEVCVRCVQHFSERNWSEPQFGFIRKVARRVSIDQYRRAAARKTVTMSQETVDPLDNEDPHQLALASEGRFVLRRRVNELPRLYRDPIVERFFHDAKPSEIAKKLRIPLNTVKTRLQRGLRMLQSDPTLRNYFAERLARCRAASSHN